MSFKNFLDLRKKTQQQTRIIERVVFQNRSIKSDIFLALSVILVASFIVWGIGRADDSVLETPIIIPEVATVVESIMQASDSSVIPAPVSTSINSGKIQSENSGLGSPLSTARMTDGKYTFTNNKTNITTTINIPQKAGTYTFTTNASPLPLVIEVVGTTNTNITDTSNGWWGKVKSFFGM